MGTKKLQKEKWRFAIGTTSRVPKEKKFHYLMLDIDGTQENIDDVEYSVRKIAGRYRIQKTKNGWHVFTDSIGKLKDVALSALALGADPVWVRIAKKRGYFFLADKDIVQLDWPVERMILVHGKKTKTNARKA
jgi:hypothetical protein